MKGKKASKIYLKNCLRFERKVLRICRKKSFDEDIWTSSPVFRWRQPRKLPETFGKVIGVVETDLFGNIAHSRGRLQQKLLGYCIPLIASSILSKKLAAGSDAIVLDVKTGSGALMQTLDESIDLAQAMVRIGELAGKPTLAMVTGMDQPLGTHVGNALEVREAIEILAGSADEKSADLREVSLTLGGQMLLAAGLADSLEAAKEKMRAALESGAGLQKFREMIAAQGGDARVADDVGLLPRAKLVTAVPAARDGYVAAMDTTAIGYVAQGLGAGRARKDDTIDPAVGLVMDVRIGDFVRAGEPICHIHANAAARADAAAKRMQEIVLLSDEEPVRPPLIYATVTPEGVV